MNLDKTTFGRSPAALYLGLYLSEKNNPVLVRKVGRTLTKWRGVIQDVIASHLQTDEMRVQTFNALLTVLDVQVRVAAQLLPDKLCVELVTNLLVGELKSWKTRAAHTARLQSKVNRAAKRGETVPELKVTPRRGEETEEERIERLKARSRDYLARKGKVNTLY